MIEVKDLNGLIDNFPMYFNVSLPVDVAIKVEDAYLSLLVYRDKDQDTSWLPFNNEVFFIEDSASVGYYLSNIFYEERKRARVLNNISNAISINTNSKIFPPKIIFVDMSAIGEHKNLLTLMDTYPDAKIVLISGIASYIKCFIKEMQKLRPNIELDYILSRDIKTIKEKVTEILK